jgi:hypothetical protein
MTPRSILSTCPSRKLTSLAQSPKFVQLRRATEFPGEKSCFDHVSHCEDLISLVGETSVVLLALKLLLLASSRETVWLLSEDR